MPVYVLAALASMPKENANNKKGRVVPACLPLDWVNITAADPKVRQKYLVDNSWHGAQRSKVICLFCGSHLARSRSQKMEFTLTWFADLGCNP